MFLSGSLRMSSSTAAHSLREQEEEDIMSTTQSGVLESPVSPNVVSSLPARVSSVELASSRAFASNPNHHLWKNGRLWWIAFTLIHDGWRQERVRQSLGTDSLPEARRRRDAILGLFAKEAEGGADSDPEGCCIDPEPDYAPFRTIHRDALSCC
jgi:hypothetical protein